MKDKEYAQSKGLLLSHVLTQLRKIEDVCYDGYIETDLRTQFLLRTLFKIDHNLKQVYKEETKLINILY